MDVRVRYPEVDRMGVVYHAHYLVWCDIGRTELIRRLWKPYAELEDEGLLLAVSDCNVRYHVGARYDDRVRVETTLEEVRSRAVTFGYVISRQDGEKATRLATARIGLIAITPEGRTRTLPGDLVAAFRQALNAGAETP